MSKFLLPPPYLLHTLAHFAAKTNVAALKKNNKTTFVHTRENSSLGAFLELMPRKHDYILLPNWFHFNHRLHPRLFTWRRHNHFGRFETLFLILHTTKYNFRTYTYTQSTAKIYQKKPHKKSTWDFVVNKHDLKEQFIKKTFTDKALIASLLAFERTKNDAFAITRGLWVSYGELTLKGVICRCKNMRLKMQKSLKNLYNSQCAAKN